MQEDASIFGIDWNGPLSDEDDSQVSVPHTHCPLSQDQFVSLQSRVSPLGDSENHGIDLYLQTLTFVAQAMMQ